MGCVVFTMDDRNIEDALDESFEMSDDDFLDPDYCVEQKNNDDSLDGIDILWIDTDDSILEGNNIDFAEERNIDLEINANNENVESNNNTENNNILQLEHDNVDGELQPTISKGKKRKLNPSLWKRNLSKIQRAKGEECVSLRNKIIQKRVTGPECKCKWKCFDNFTNDEKLLILDNFNKIADKQKQDTYLGGLIKTRCITRRRPKDGSGKQKSFSSEYKIRISLNEVRVCKKAFCSLFGVGKFVVERICNNLNNNIPSPTDGRGKHLSRPNRISDPILSQIYTHTYRVFLNIYPIIVGMIIMKKDIWLQI